MEACGKSRVLIGGLAAELHRRNLRSLYRRLYGEPPAILDDDEDDYYEDEEEDEEDYGYKIPTVNHRKFASEMFRIRPGRRSRPGLIQNIFRKG